MNTVAHSDGFNWGDVPTWLSAVGTLLAFAVSLRLLYLNVADPVGCRA